MLGDCKNFNIRLSVKYRTNKNEVISREAIIPIITTSRELAVELAKTKARKQLSLFDYIIQSSVEVEKLKRERKKNL